jgi:nucleotidyltransferase/DNA polymerase involved in DNA repair
MMTQKIENNIVKFYGFDGDKIGSIVELYIIKGELDALSLFSRNVSTILAKIRDDIVGNGGSVIFCAGDSILFNGQFDDAWCKKILDDFAVATGRTASLGVGDSSMVAYLALKLAKAMGGGRVFYFPLQA